MARCLIIGCGCRGRALATELRARGHAVRGTSRDPGSAEQIEASGAAAVIGDPDRLATFADALDHVSIACVLLGSATGPREQLAALHGPRLAMLLARMLDTTVRGILYEAAGTVEPSVLAHGADKVRAVCEDSRIPYVLLRADPLHHEEWVRAAARAIEDLLGRD
ncbi:MAG: NAD(P)H-binding protein [Solirubrobacteraceae bacterium]